MERREMLKKMSLYMGGVVSAPTLAAILKGCAPKPGVDWKPTYFSEDQAYVVETIAEIIIPKTDTPGAKDVGVPPFIEEVIRDTFDEEAKAKFMSGFDELEARSQKDYGDSFSGLNGDQQKELVISLNREMVEDRKAAGEEEGSGFFRTIKELTFYGFFESEAGATQVLQYSAVPGAYDGCVPLEEIGKTWAT